MKKIVTTDLTDVKRINKRILFFKKNYIKNLTIWMKWKNFLKNVTF